MRIISLTINFIKTKTLQLFILLSVFQSIGQNREIIKYTLNHTFNSNNVEVIIQFNTTSTNTIKLVIPRSALGTYELTNYISFAKNVKGYTTSNKVLNGKIGIGSFFIFEEKNETLKSVSYEIDIKKWKPLY